MITNLLISQDWDKLFDSIEPDCECEIEAFSSLILGRFDKIKLVPGLKIYKNEESVGRLFRKKEMWLDEHF